MQLQRPVGDVESGIRREPLGHRAPHRRIRSLVVDRERAVAHHEPRGLKIGAHVGDREQDRLLLGQRLTERHPLVHVLHGTVERPLRTSERARRDVEAAAVERRHRDREAPALIAEHVGCRDAHAVEDHLTRGLRVPAHLLLRRAEAQALGVAGHQERTDASGPRLARPRHHDVDRSLTRSRDELLDAREQVVVAVAHRARGDVRSVRSGSRFGEAVAAELLHRGERGQPPAALRIVAVGVDHPDHHVVDRDVRGDRRVALGELFEDRDGVGAAQPGAAELLSRIDAAQAELPRLAEGLAGEDVLLVALGGERGELGVGELADGVEDGLAFFGGGGDGRHGHVISWGRASRLGGLAGRARRTRIVSAWWGSRSSRRRGCRQRASGS